MSLSDNEMRVQNLSKIHQKRCKLQFTWNRQLSFTEKRGDINKLKFYQYQRKCRPKLVKSYTKVEGWV